MICFTILTLVIGVVLSAPTEDLPMLFIVGGKPANQELFNYQVSLLNSGEYKCSGTLLRKNIVITAAHCTQGIPPHLFQVRVGSQSSSIGGQLVYVQDVITHAGFTVAHFRNDVAILKLSQDVTLSKKVGTVELTDVEPTTGTPAVTSGWGLTHEDGSLSINLLYVTVPILDRSYCQQQLNSRYAFTKEMICAGKKEGGIDACQGDSGGPLIANKKLVGIISWGNGCARPGKPGVYTNVAHLRSWIDQAIQQILARN